MNEKTTVQELLRAAKNLRHLLDELCREHYGMTVPEALRCTRCGGDCARCGKGAKHAENKAPDPGDGPGGSV